MGVYTIIGTLGTVFIFILTLTDKASNYAWLIWVAAAFLGIAVGGMWLITALIVLDDSGS